MRIENFEGCRSCHLTFADGNGFRTSIDDELCTGGMVKEIVRMNDEEEPHERDWAGQVLSSRFDHDGVFT